LVPEQHPLAQLLELQLAAHTPPLHTPEAHTEQAAPPEPQLEVVLPGSHVLPLQQPLEHEVALQTHAPATHCCPLAQGPPIVPHVHAPPAVQVSEVMPQAAHVAPSAPHWAEDVGVTHAVPLQQPPGHDAESHTHAPPRHCWPATHSGPEPHSQTPLDEQPLARFESHAEQALPSVPQSVRVGGDTQASPLQQPVVHELELQTQAPATHSWPATHMGFVPHWQAPEVEQLSASVVLHATQAEPPVPQLVNVGDMSHVDPEQQPPAQPDELQSPGHVPPLHEPVLHATHAAPPLPHMAVIVPGSHVVPLQQPIAHEVESQVQAPLTQSWPVAQAGPLPQVHAPPAEHVSAAIPHAAQVAPLLPQRDVVLPGSHVAPRQHPPGHEVESQTQVPPLHSCPAPH
jgi:hypothetical protein